MDLYIDQSNKIKMPRSIFPINPDDFDYGLCPPKNRYALDQVPLEFADATQSHNDVVTHLANVSYVAPKLICQNVKPVYN